MVVVVEVQRKSVFQDNSAGDGDDVRINVK